MKLTNRRIKLSEATTSSSVPSVVTTPLDSKATEKAAPVDDSNLEELSKTPDPAASKTEIDQIVTAAVNADSLDIDKLIDTSIVDYRKLAEEDIDINAKVARLIADPDVIAELGEYNAESFLTTFDEEDIHEMYDDLYSELTEDEDTTHQNTDRSDEAKGADGSSPKADEGKEASTPSGSINDDIAAILGESDDDSDDDEESDDDDDIPYEDGTDEELPTGDDTKLTEEELDKLIEESIKTGANLEQLIEDATMIKKKKKKRVDPKLSRIAKLRYRKNKASIQKGMKKFRSSSAGRAMYKKLGRFNARHAESIQESIESMIDKHSGTTSK